MPCQTIKKVYQNSGGIEIETLIDFYLFLEDLTTSLFNLTPSLYLSRFLIDLRLKLVHGLLGECDKKPW
jgi:hypothetical protein